MVFTYLKYDHVLCSVNCMNPLVSSISLADSETKKWKQNLGKTSGRPNSHPGLNVSH